MPSRERSLVVDRSGTGGRQGLAIHLIIHSFHLTIRIRVTATNQTFRSIKPNIKCFSSSIKPITTAFFERGVQNISMCSPHNRNALSLQMMEELIKHITEKENDVNLRAIVIRGEGPVFSAGHNLKELSSAAGSDMHMNVFRVCSELMMAIIRCPVPVIASVNGLAAAAGCQLVAGCDMAVCSENSSFSTPGARFGIFCSTPGVALVRAVPLKVASDMLFTGNAISAQQALQYGLVSRVAIEGKLDEEVTKITTAVMEKSRAVIEMGKKFLYTQVEKDLITAYRYGQNVMASNAAHPDGQEGIQSFVEKRKPHWKHS